MRAHVTLAGGLLDVDQDRNPPKIKQNKQFTMEKWSFWLLETVILSYVTIAVNLFKHEKYFFFYLAKSDKIAIVFKDLYDQIPQNFK